MNKANVEDLSINASNKLTSKDGKTNDNNNDKNNSNKNLNAIQNAENMLITAQQKSTNSGSGSGSNNNNNNKSNGKKFLKN